MNTSVKIVLTVLGFCLSVSLSAQTQKHTVQQGETVYAIGRKYNVSPNEILRLNPSLGAGDNIRPGQILTIPQGKATSATPSTPAASTQQPATQQPAAPVQQPTYTIEVPARSQAQTPIATIPPQGAQQQNGYLNSGCKEMYKIQKKDNLYRIALNYGLSIEELVEANPGLTPDSKLKKGEFLCIPYSRAERQAEANRIAAEKAAAEAAIKAKMKSYSKHMNVAVLLPIKEGGDRGNKMLEFYRGLLMAADSIKYQGTSVDIYTYHSGASANDMKFVLTKPELKNMDLIFGPLDAAQASVLSDFCLQHNIRLVMPFATTNTYGQNNPYVYHASINAETARKNAVDLIVDKFNNHDYVILSTGAGDERGARFTSELRTQLTAKGNNVRTLHIDSDEATYVAAFNQFRNNLIIPDASSLSTTAALARKLQNFKKAHPEFKISVIGYPEWPTYVSTLLADFYALDTYAYCTFYRNPTEGRVTTFENRFKQNFKKDMAHTFPRYGMFGFDLGYYFMHGLVTQGDNFEERQGALRFIPYQNAFQFGRSSANTSFTNKQVMLVHYTNSQRIEIIK